MTYQKVTGPLMASGYQKLGTQKAMNGMYIISNWDGGQISPTLTKENADGSQRMPDKNNFNCIIQKGGDGMMDVSNSNTIVRRLTPL